jgi:hypothetical protein
MVVIICEIQRTTSDFCNLKRMRRVRGVIILEYYDGFCFELHNKRLWTQFKPYKNLSPSSRVMLILFYVVGRYDLLTISGEDPLV